jgi:hypothetical protein
MSTRRHYFVEQRQDGRYAVRAEGSRRASELVTTQADAIDCVKTLNPQDHPNVERVRTTKAGDRAHWRSTAK